MFESSYGLCSEKEENPQIDEGLSDNKRLTEENGGSILLKENVCQVGVLRPVYIKNYNYISVHADGQ